MSFLHPPYFLIWGLWHASNLNLRSPLASPDGFGERSISPDYSPPLWGIMAEDQRLSPHKEFNGPNTLSLQITVESLMQFWPDFDAALYWCGVTPQQSNKVRSQQWLSWSSWKDVLPPGCAGGQGGGWARRKVPAFVEHHPCQPAGSRSPWVRVRSGPVRHPGGPPSFSGGGSAGSPGPTSARRPGGLGGEALGQQRRESELSISPVRGSIPAPWGRRLSPGSGTGARRAVPALYMPGYTWIFYGCVYNIRISKQTNN